VSHGAARGKSSWLDAGSILDFYKSKTIVDKSMRVDDYEKIGRPRWGRPPG
jgi:hypothetical protein